MADLRLLYQQFNAAYPFEANFLDDASESYYANQQVMATLSQSFALIAILIACLGLLLPSPACGDDQAGEANEGGLGSESGESGSATDVSRLVARLENSVQGFAMPRTFW